MKTIQIPFKVAPKERFTTIGTETTGILEVPCKLFLTVAEKMAIEDAKLVDVQREIASLAKTLADDLNKSQYKPKDAKRISLLAVNDAIARRVNGDLTKEDSDNALIGEHLEELLKLQERAVKARDTKIKTYAVMIAKSRLGIECTADELENAIGESLMTSLGLFGIYEEMGSVYKQTPEETEENDKSAVEAAEEVTEEDILK